MPVEFDEVVDRITVNRITDAARKAETGAGASPVLVAVVREFREKLAKSEGHMVDGVTRLRRGDRAGAGRRQRQGRS